LPGRLARRGRGSAPGSGAATGGLSPSAAASGDFLITDGPYAETKEHLAGFFIINAAERNVALEWAKLAAVAQQRPIEVRRFFDGNLDDAIRGMASGGMRGT
jgi:hypothetical protein